MQRWEYLTVQLGHLGKEACLPIGPRFVNGQELKDRMSIGGYVSQFGDQGWEMTGSLSVSGTPEHYLFFKRMIFDLITIPLIP